MQIILRVVAIACLMLISINIDAKNTPWGADYFPNVVLTTHEGKNVRFFDDLIKDKIVAINFIYTTCPDTCPLETAQLLRVQEILGDRLGQDVFFYSITIDPDVDSPPVLNEYRDRFGAEWTFLTGKETDIIQLRRKLGLYIEEIQDGSNNHNVSMIIGNQSTGRWMKRSPFENPYVLADQLGNWLDGWKSPQKTEDYASAPKLRNISKGEQLFRTRCQTCHTVTGKELPNALGPDLAFISEKRDYGWLMNWLRAPDQMLAAKDPIAMALFKKYNNLAMPNMRLNQHEANDLLNYIKEESQHLRKISNASKPPSGIFSPKVKPQEDVVAVMNAWVRKALPKSPVQAGYLTLINMSENAESLVEVESALFGSVEIHEMSMKNGMMKMKQLSVLEIPSSGQIKLSPGGKHLMLKKPVRDLALGEVVELTLKFKSGKTQSLSLRVEDK